MRPQSLYQRVGEGHMRLPLCTGQVMALSLVTCWLGSSGSLPLPSGLTGESGRHRGHSIADPVMRSLVTLLVISWSRKGTLFLPPPGYFYHPPCGGTGGWKAWHGRARLTSRVSRATPLALAANPRKAPANVSGVPATISEHLPGANPLRLAGGSTE